jgi:hypothetical protein
MVDVDNFKPIKGYQNGIGYVYLIESVFDKTTVKIGCTKNPKQRLQVLNSQLPFTVQFKHIVLADDMFKYEKQLHSSFSHKRLSKEWYCLNDADFELIKWMDYQFDYMRLTGAT